jgi:hypothetical protein
LVKYHLEIGIQFVPQLNLEVWNFYFFFISKS